MTGRTEQEIRADITPTPEATTEGGWTVEDWQEWSNDIAELLPERYDNDMAQESLILDAVRDLVERDRAAVTPTPEATTDEEFETLDDELRGLTGTWVNDPHLDRSTAIRCANDVGAVLDLHLPAPVTPTPEATTERTHTDTLTGAVHPGSALGCTACAGQTRRWGAAAADRAVTGHPTDEPPKRCPHGKTRPHWFDKSNDPWGGSYRCPGPAGRLVPQRDDDECDEPAPIVVLWGDEQRVYCTRRVGHRGPHRSGQTEWRAGRVPVADPTKED